VKVKMLPFDNKSEFQVILNMPRGSTLEQTTAVIREMAAAVRTEPEVRDYEIYAGTAAPFNFNGLVRHYFMRRGSDVADLQVNLLPKDERKAQSHDIARRVRPRLAAIAAKLDAAVAVAEVPPGPPVLQTLVAEIYGPNEEARLKLAEKVREIYRSTPGVVDVDWYVEREQPKTVFHVDKARPDCMASPRPPSHGPFRWPCKISGDAAACAGRARGRECRTRIATRAARPPGGSAGAVRPLGAQPQAPLVPLRELVTVERTAASATFTTRTCRMSSMSPATWLVRSKVRFMPSSR